MKYFIPVLISLLLLSACGQTQDKSARIPAGADQKKSADEAVATFAEGCFWHSEIVFQSLQGVRDAVSGYAGGKDTDPDYDNVSEGTSGHAETVQIYYDPKVITYETLVKALFASMDPTQLNGQGNDRGSQYRSIAFYRTEQEKKIIEEEIKRLTNAHVYKNEIVTEVIPFKTFYPAEAYHQEYIAHHPDEAYVRNVSIPEYQEFRRQFKGNFKP